MVGLKTYKIKRRAIVEARKAGETGNVIRVLDNPVYGKK
jgi:hypothetical protein|tara:strand:+ start:650 stop:766 length:117 start_codon:yes stop_codon:yes gene_type:complete